MSEEDHPAAAASRETSVKRPLEQLRILVVDDDDLVLSGTAAMLQDLGHTVFEAASGHDALAILNKGERIDVIITDEVMPEMSGTELAATIRARWPQVPVILTSGHVEEPPNADSELMKLGKPFSQNLLSWAIAECMRASRRSRTVVAFRQR